MLMTILTLIGAILPQVLKGFGVSATIDNLASLLPTTILAIINGIATNV